MIKIGFDSYLSRLNYNDANNNGSITATEITEENNYYPFGLKHKGYNGVIGSTNPAMKYKYNGVELEEALDYDMYEMDFRHYDAALGRFNSIDPVTHYSMSTYTAFDNNPIYWADPSGADSASSFQDAIDQAMDGGSSTWYSDGNGGFTDEKPKEGETKDVEKTINGIDGETTYTEKKIYHSGGLGYDAGWKTKSQYAEIIHSIAVELAGTTKMGKGFGSVQWLSNVDAIEGFKEMVSNYSGLIYGQVQVQNYFMTTGQINTDDLSTILLILPVIRTLQLTKIASNLIPEGKLANHLFKGANKLIDSPTNRSLIQEISNGRALGVDAYGKSWYARTMPNGTQIYTYTQNGIIKGSGVNGTAVDIVARYGLK